VFVSGGEGIEIATGGSIEKIEFRLDPAA
jgi:hypothetical protein